MEAYRAISLLMECRGDEIWSVGYCRELGIPEEWIEQLAEAHESGFRYRAQQIWTDDGLVNQYFGVSDARLAVRLATELGIRTDSWIAQPISPLELVRRIRAELDEL